MTKIDKKVDAVLERNPDITRGEAIKYVTTKASKKRDAAIDKNQRLEARKQSRKGKTPTRSVNTVSGGKCTPR